MQYFDALSGSNEPPVSRKRSAPRLLRALAFFTLSIEIAYVAGLFGCSPQGCSSGQTPPTGYSCGSLSGGGAPCFAEVSFCCGTPPSGGFFPPSILGYRTNVFVNQQITAGDGSIGNALTMLASNTNSFIMVGYENNATGAILQGCSAAGFFYFLEQIDATGSSHQCLAAVKQADFGQYAVVSIVPNGSPPTTATSFTVSITTPATNLSNTVNNPLWLSGGSQFAIAEFGQRLVGSQGASATTLLFYGNGWIDTSGQIHPQSFDGAITANNPPFGSWVRPPSQSGSVGDGGDFFAECCLAPDTVYPAAVDFSTVTTGTTSVPQTILITNNTSSSGNLNITGISIGGTNASDFKVATNGCGSSLAPLASCSITVTFTPSASGPRTATLNVSDNGGSGSGTDSANLTGIGG